MNKKPNKSIKANLSEERAKRAYCNYYITIEKGTSFV